MGMFDNVTIRWPLPWPEVQNSQWQSKDTPTQFLNDYEVREDGTLWHLAYDQRIEKDAKHPMGFHLYRDNERWEQVDWDGGIECHEYIEHENRPGGMEYSVTFWFRNGRVADAVYWKQDLSPAIDG